MSKNDGSLKTYLFCYKAADINHFHIVRRWLEKRQGIIAHDSTVPLIHLLRTNMSATQLQEEVDFLFPEGDYFITEINPRNTDGKLRAEDWNWLNYTGNMNKGIHQLTLKMDLAKS